MARGPSQIGRAPAHLTVLPGGLPGGLSGGLDELEDERTTIEPEPPSSLADEAPTPIAAASASMDEQWEDGTTVAESGEKRTLVDEPTVEDQARPLPPLQLVQSHGIHTGAADPRAFAKLAVVAGSDQGRVFDLRPGKDLSVGRAVDNDIVLTDIAVSRRHLELSWDGEAWVLRDRGSGNGTLINERIEDGRCHLHDGDRVEIGNTVFRFDHPPSASAPTVTGWGQDDEEAATVAGKTGSAPRRSPAAPPTGAEPPRARPNSVTAAPSQRAVPPPNTPRSKRASQAPPPPPERERLGTVRGMPVVAPQRAAPVPAPPPEMQPQFLGGPPSGPPSGPVTSPQPIAATFGPGARPATTTALVEPRMYVPAPYPFVVAPDSRRKHLMIGAGVAAFIAFVGIGAMLSGDEETPAPTAALSASDRGDGEAKDDPPTPTPAPAPDPVPAAVVASPTPAAVPPPTPPPPVPTPIAVPAATVEPPAPAPTLAPTPTPAPVAETAPPPAPTPTPPPAPTPTPEAIETPAPVVKPPPKATPPKATPPKATPPKAVPPKISPRISPRSNPRNNEDLLTAVEKKPAATAIKGLAGIEKKAEGLYRAKDFKGAASLLREAASTASEADARRLKALAGDYDTIGINLPTGTTLPKSRATEALGALKKAYAADRRAGGEFQQVIRERMAQVAPSAAAAYMAKQNYPMAKLAADDAVNVGAGSNETVANVRASLEKKAGELYVSAQKLLADKPEEAKTLLRNIIKIVPSDSPWYSKAYKLLNQRKPAATDDDE